jgi:hypothetical protein
MMDLMRSMSPISCLSERLQEAQHLQALEGNPLTEAELAMFEMFEREAWSHERRREYIREFWEKSWVSILPVGTHPAQAHECA